MRIPAIALALLAVALSAHARLSKVKPASSGPGPVHPVPRDGPQAIPVSRRDEEAHAMKRQLGGGNPTDVLPVEVPVDTPNVSRELSSPLVSFLLALANRDTESAARAEGRTVVLSSWGRGGYRWWHQCRADAYTLGSWQPLASRRCL